MATMVITDMALDSQALSVDGSIVTRAKQGVATAVGHARIAAWFKRWRRPIRSWMSAKQCVPDTEVDDLTQEVFVRLLRYSDCALVDNPQGYLFRIASNVVQSWREHCRVRLPHDDVWLGELLVESADEPENACARAGISQYLRTVVDRLPARQREILLLHVNEGLTYNQIAQMRGLTYRAVLRDLTRAYATLRMELLPADQYRPGD